MHVTCQRWIINHYDAEYMSSSIRFCSVRSTQLVFRRSFARILNWNAGNYAESNRAMIYVDVDLFNCGIYHQSQYFFLAFKPQGPINEWILNLHTVGGTGRSVPDSNSQNIHASRIFVFILLRINSNDLNNSKQHLRSPRNRTNDGGLCYANTGGISLTADMVINNDHAESTQLSYR